MIATLKLRPEFAPLSVLRALWKRRWFAAGFWLFGTVATVAVVFSLPPLYTANAVVLVESQAIPEAFVTATVQTTLEARLDMLKQQVLSRDRLWGLVEEFNLYPAQRRRLTKEEVLRVVREDVNINLVRGWNSRGPGAFEVGYRAPIPETAAKVANRVALFFINENLRQRTGEALGTSDFLNQQLAEAEKRLREHEVLLKEFKLSHNGELPQQEGALLASMSQSRAELLGIQDAIGRAQQSKLILEGSASYAQALLRERQDAARRQALQAGRPQAETAGSGGVVVPLPLPAPSELERARRDLRTLRGRYFDSHPDVQRMLAEVARLEREEAERTEETKAQPAAVQSGEASRAATLAPRAAAASDAVESAQPADTYRIDEIRAQIALADREIRSLEARRANLLEEIADSQNRVRAIPVREQQLADITRNYEICKTSYDSLLNKKLAADVATNMERWQKSQKFVMLDQARVPQKPTRPRRALLIPAGMLFSLVAGFGLAFVLQLKENVLLGEWELPAGTPVIARVPRLNAARA